MSQQITDNTVFRQHLLGHVQVYTGAQRFAMVSGLNTCFLETVCNGVQQGLRYVLSCLVSKMSAQSAATCI